MPETFSSEIGHVQRDAGSSFANEFRGASDSLIERDRPPRPLEASRRARRIVLSIVLLAGVLGGGGYALWYWSEPIGEWIASWNRSEKPAAEPTPTDADEPAQAESEPVVEPEPEPVVEPEPPTEPANPQPTIEAPPIPPGEGLPVEPLDVPASKPASVKAGATSVRGKVASSTVTAKLATVDAALEGCWASAAAKPETKRPANVRLRFSIKWNGRAFGVAVDGDAPKQLRECVREALPSSGWPQPRDGGEASVSRSWTLE